MNPLFRQRKFGPSLALQKAIEQVLLELKLWGRWRELAQAILEVSNHFINSAGQTPWNTPQHQAAYLLYFLPLNVARLEAVFHESQKLGLKWDQPVVDMGSGPGTCHFAALNRGLTFSSWSNWEHSTKAIAIHKKILEFLKPQNSSHVIWSEKPLSLRRAHVVSSYALNEWSSWPEELFQAETLVVVEPSTQESGRRLMEFREQLLKQEFFIWAPCTHQQNCPLLHESKRDWCHDRIQFQAPFWWDELAPFLPMTNDTLTFSYLIASRTAKTWQNTPGHLPARVIGDTLFEKGKTRQAVCRGPQREFLSWLKKEGPADLIPHGELIELAENLEKKGNELRVRFQL